MWQTTLNINSNLLTQKLGGFNQTASSLSTHTNKCAEIPEHPGVLTHRGGNQKDV